MTPHRERAIAWAQSIVTDPRAVICDTETTGLGDDAEIIDIAIVGMDGRILLDALVKPLRPIPPEATAVHGINDEMVADSAYWDEVFSCALADIPDRYCVVAYNAPYDAQMVNQCCRAYGLPEIACNWQDALKAYSDFDGAPGKYPGQFRWHKLDAAAKHFGIEPGGHRALADAEATRQVIHAMAAYTEPSEPDPVALPVQPSLFAVETPRPADRWRE